MFDTKFHFKYNCNMYVPKKAISCSISLAFLLSFTGLYSCEEKEELITDIKTIKDVSKNNFCKDGLPCGNDSDCFDGTCNQGVCHCQTNFCQKDEDCGENKCCNQLNGSCYDCIKDIGDIDVIDDLSMIDIGADVLTDTQFADTIEDIADTNIFECETDFNCNLEKPYCNPDKKICVECYLNKHCQSGECVVETGVCMNVSDDTGIEMVMDTGIDAITDVNTDPCIDYICLCGTICVVNSGNPECVNGCKVDTDCCANTVCKNGQCEKTTCTDDSDCKDQSKPHCENISGICYECTNDLHCQSNYYCDSSHTCKYKIDECFGQCEPDTQWCNPVKKQCEDIPTNWCADCTQILDPICLLDSLQCGTLTKKCTKQCNDDSECFGYTCNPFGWCTCP